MKKYMPKKKKIDTEKQKLQDIQAETEEKKPQSLNWNELDKYMGQPVWDSREKKWRILDGYRRSGNTYSITFTDIADWVSFIDRNLYLEEVSI